MIIFFQNGARNKIIWWMRSFVVFLMCVFFMLTESEVNSFHFVLERKKLEHVICELLWLCQRNSWWKKVEDSSHLLIVQLILSKQRMKSQNFYAWGVGETSSSLRVGVAVVAVVWMAIVAYLCLPLSTSLKVGGPLTDKEGEITVGSVELFQDELFAYKCGNIWTLRGDKVKIK